MHPMQLLGHAAADCTMQACSLATNAKLLPLCHACAGEAQSLITLKYKLIFKGTAWAQDVVPPTPKPTRRPAFAADIKTVISTFFKV